jgi:hypothetical protein
MKPPVNPKTVPLFLQKELASNSAIRQPPKPQNPQQCLPQSTRKEKK